MVCLGPINALHNGSESLPEMVTLHDAGLWRGAASLAFGYDTLAGVTAMICRYKSEGARPWVWFHRSVTDRRDVIGDSAVGYGKTIFHNETPSDVRKRTPLVFSLASFLSLQTSDH